MELQELELCFVHHNPTDLGLEQSKNKQAGKKMHEEKPDSAQTRSSASATGIFEQC